MSRGPSTDVSWTPQSTRYRADPYERVASYLVVRIANFTVPQHDLQIKVLEVNDSQLVALQTQAY